MYVSGNASSFAVLSAARYAVFDRHGKTADEAYWNSSSAPVCLKTLSRVLQASNVAHATSSREICIPKASLNLLVLRKFVLERQPSLFPGGGHRLTQRV